MTKPSVGAVSVCQSSPIIYGHVTEWRDDRGYRFIRSDGRLDVFVHITHAPDGEPLTVGQCVKFTHDDVGKGPRVVWLEVV